MWREPVHRVRHETFVALRARGAATPIPPRAAAELRRRRLRRWGRRPRSLLHDVTILAYLLIALILVFAAL
jgi:hypothetical protein